MDSCPPCCCTNTYSSIVLWRARGREEVSRQRRAFNNNFIVNSHKCLFWLKSEQSVRPCHACTTSHYATYLCIYGDAPSVYYYYYFHKYTSRLPSELFMVWAEGAEVWVRGRGRLEDVGKLRLRTSGICGKQWPIWLTHLYSISIPCLSDHFRIQSTHILAH